MAFGVDVEMGVGFSQMFFYHVPLTGEVSIYSVAFASAETLREICLLSRETQGEETGLSTLMAKCLESIFRKWNKFHYI